MPETAPSQGGIADSLRRALASRDWDALAPLLAEDVRWGDGDDPRSCRNRGDVLALMAARLAEGADAEIGELVEGSAGVLCRLDVRWPESSGRRARTLYHVYRVEDGLVREIRPFDDRDEAAEVAGLGRTARPG